MACVDRLEQRVLLAANVTIDEFTAQIVRTPTLATYAQLFTQPANLDIVIRTVTMAVFGASSLYGSGALSGAINILPRRARENFVFSAEAYGGARCIALL